MINGTKDRWEEFNLIIDSIELDLKEKGLLIILFRYVNYRKGYSDPSRELIKKLTAISDDRTLDKIFDSIIKKGFLNRESGKGIRSKYFIKLPVKSEGTVINVGTVINAESTCNSCSEVPVKITGQKEKKRKEKENIYSAFDSYTDNEELKTTLKDFAEMRKAIKKPLTSKAITILLNKLNKLGAADNEKKLILEQSIFNNWQGIFELKENKRDVGRNKPEREISNFDY